MRPVLTGLFYLIAAFLVWGLDGAILAFYSGGEIFQDFIFTKVPLARLIVRGLLSALLLFAGYLKIRRQLASKDIFNIWLGDEKESLFCGCAESHLRPQRLLFHSLRLAKYFKLSQKEKEGLRTLCYCYDIGLVSIPNAVLNKEGELTQKEQEIWDSHTRRGAEIIAAITDLAPGAQYILYHEEYFNGGGIFGLHGRKIPLACRIFQTVWMYDCMIYPPGRQNPLVCDEALLELRYYSGSALDPEVVEAFIRIMGKNSILSGNRGRVFSLR